MKKCILNLILIIFTLSCLVHAQQIKKEGDHFKAKIENSYPVKPGGTLELKSVKSDVRIESWENSSVQIIQNIEMDVYTQDEAEEIVERMKGNTEIDGNTVRIKGLDGKSWINGDYEIKVPSKFTLDIKLAAGDVTIEGVTGDHTISTAGGDIVLNDLTGVISVNTAGGDFSFSDISGRLSAKTSGGDVNLENIFAEADIKTSGGDIIVKHSTNRLNANTSGGDILIEEADGSVNAATSGGDIKVDDFKGDQLSLHTNGGDIELVGIHGVMSANTNGGDISGRNFTGQIQAMTNGGDISLRDVKAPATAANTGGDIELEITLTDFSKPHNINLKSTAGDITLILPEKLPATITAEIQQFGKKSADERGDIYSDFPLTKSVDDETGGKIIRSTGKINGGGDAIDIRVQSGDIYIKKSK